MDQEKKSRVRLPGTESASEVLDFAAIANSVRPPSAPVALPAAASTATGTAAREPRTGVSWIWIAAGVGGALLGALGAVVAESQLQKKHATQSVAAVQRVEASEQAVKAEPRIEPTKPAAPLTPAFVSVEDTEPADEPVAQSQKSVRTSKPATVVAAQRDPSHKLKTESAPEANLADVAERAKSAESASVEETTSDLVEDEATETETPVDLPARPDRETVARLLNNARVQITACAAGQHGRADITLRVGSSGRVKSAVVDGAFRGTSEGSCMARAIRGLRFPAFSEDTFEIAYPYQL